MSIDSFIEYCKNNQIPRTYWTSRQHRNFIECLNYQDYVKSGYSCGGYKANKERYDLWHKIYVKKNREKVRQYLKNYYQKNKERILKQHKEYREKTIKGKANENSSIATPVL